jgi:ribosomal subunit interface protein
MIERFDIHFIHSDHDENLKKYVTKKIGRLDRYLPRHARSSAHAEVALKEGKAGKAAYRRDCTCEVTLHLPHEVINVSESSINLYTAVDIIELKLKHQIQKYKELHGTGTFRRRLANKFLKQPTAQV